VKVLLRRDVKGIGRRGDIVTVSSGHARNFLIPNGLAVEATEGAVAQAETLKRSRDLREAATRIRHVPLPRCLPTHHWWFLQRPERLASCLVPLLPAI